MSFRHKLLASFLGLLAVVLGLSLATVQRQETRRAEAELRSDLGRTNEVFKDILDRQDRELAANLKLLSRDHPFKQTVALGDAGTVLSAAVNHRARMGADVMLVSGEDGMLLADTRRGRFEKGRKPPAFMRAVFENDRAESGVYLLDGEAYQLAAMTIKAPDTIGVLAAGYRIDDRFAAPLKNLTRTEVSFIVDGKVAGSTLGAEDRARLAAEAGSFTDAPRLLTVGPTRYLAVSSKAHPLVSSVVMRSWDEALRPLRSMQRRLLWVGLVGLAAAGLLGLVIAKSLTASLDQLVKAAAKIASGRYDIEVDIPSSDEIGRLGRAFTDMARGLMEREKIRSILHKSVSKEIAESLVAQGTIELGGEEKDVTVLFSDIRSFTTISESLAPKELVGQLNEYFTGMARAIDEHHGVIDKYIGDAVMALFGAPLGKPEDPANALRAALAMAQALDALNAERAKKGLPAWKNGIGINTGPVVAGTLGSEERWSYTVIGDAVNVASRLESVTKDYGAQIIASARTKELAGAGFRWKPLGSVKVKGKTEALEIFELLGEG